jgi:tetratricopeptide (TPR) repeat protein
MSGAPTSGAEPDELEALIRAGWREPELAWERCQENAGDLNAGGNFEGAAALWAEALRLARENLAGNDPRLAASLANQAHALRRAGREEAARTLFEEALLVWDASAPWIAALKPERRARSSTFHLRLEAKHPGGYAHHSRERYDALAAEGRAAIVALRDGRNTEDDGLARWHKERPEGYSDARKLLAAAFLIAAADGSGH